MNTTADPAKAAAPNGVTAQPTGTATVVIGCKLPHGLIIEVGLDKNSNKSERYRAVRLKGKRESTIIGGYGLTIVDKSLWEEWFKTHRDMTYIQKGMVFVQSTEDAAVGVAYERQGLKTGLESLQDKDERLGKAVRDNVTAMPNEGGAR